MAGNSWWKEADGTILELAKGSLARVETNPDTDQSSEGIILSEVEFLISTIKAAFDLICCLVTKLCLTLCNPMNCSTPCFPVLPYLLEIAYED